MNTIRDLPAGHYVLARIGDDISAAVPHDDPLAALARRWLHGKHKPEDEQAIRVWLATHPQFEITRLPGSGGTPATAPPVPGQLTLWEAA